MYCKRRIIKNEKLISISQRGIALFCSVLDDQALLYWYREWKEYNLEYKTLISLSTLVNDAVLLTQRHVYKDGVLIKQNSCVPAMY